MKLLNTVFLSTALLFAGASTSFAEETMKEKASEVGRDLKKNTKKAGRAIKDETCEMVNGKMECARQESHEQDQECGRRSEGQDRHRQKLMSACVHHDSHYCH